MSQNGQIDFIDPQGANAGEIRRQVLRMTDLLLAHFKQGLKRTPIPQKDFSSPSSLIPQKGKLIENLLPELQGILAHSMNLAHPGYIGHMDSMPTFASVLGDLVSSTINNNMLSREMSPSLSRLETEITRQFAVLFSLGEKSGGILTEGGTLANLQALLIARNVAFQSKENGLAGTQQRPVLFASEMAHVSVQKAAMILGLGTKAVIPVGMDENLHLDPEDLRRKIIEARNNGYQPFAVVATAGTTAAGQIDPLDQVGDISKEFGLWFHVDAAYAGALVLSEKYRPRLKGIEKADSITFNPQKWLYVTKMCAMLLFRDFQKVHQHYRISAPYMKGSENFVNLGELSIQGSRRTDVLKLWLALQCLCLEGYSRLFEQCFRLTDFFVREIKKRPNSLSLAAEPDTNIVCFRGRSSVSTDQGDKWQEKLQSELLSRGKIFLSLPILRGERWLRAVLLNPFTDEKIISRLFESHDALTERA